MFPNRFSLLKRSRIHRPWCTSRRLFAFSPSTIDNGFILSLPELSNPVTSDLAYQRVLSWYLPSSIYAHILPSLTEFGQEAVSHRVNEWIANAESQPPYVKTRNVWGERYLCDRLVTSQGWKDIGKWGAKNGVIALGYEDSYGHYRRIVQHAFNYVYSASSAVYSCPVSMTSGAARLLAQQLAHVDAAHPFHEVYQRLISRDDNWISSQWMTERPGGSDVQNSETIAVYSPLSTKANRTIGRLDEGDWLVSGYKFFCSATDCDVALMLAKTESEQLSLFLAPTRRIHSNPNGTEEVITNGIRFHRLKNKMGTKELPTAELELKNVRAWLVGPLDRGIATIATLLNVTRTHNFVTALSCWRRGMAITKNFAKARTTINQPLWTFPMHLRLLAGMETTFQGMLQLAFFTTSLLSFVDNGFPSDRPSSYAPLPSPGEQTKVVQRVLTAVGKAVICKVACISLQECQEAMGGVGFMDEPDEPEHNISRLYRDTAANMIWEGTTNVLASEIVRHLLKGSNLNVFSGWIENSLEHIQDEEIKMAVINAWSVLKTTLITGQDNIAQTLADGRQIMFSLAWVVSGILLAHDAQRDQNPIAGELSKRWVLDAECGIGEYGLPRVIYSTAVTRTARLHAEERLQWDCRIVWNSDLPGNAASGLRQPTGDKLLGKTVVHAKKQTNL